MHIFYRRSLGIFVPDAYLTAADNGDGTYTAAINENGAAGTFTAKTAPNVLPVYSVGTPWGVPT